MELDEFYGWLDANIEERGLVATDEMTAPALAEAFGSKLGRTPEERVHYARQVIAKWQKLGVR